MARLAHNKIHWTEDELNYLKDNYLDYANQEMAKVLNKTCKNVTKTLRRLGLYKSSESKASIRSRRNKEVGTDLSYDYIKEVASNFNSRGEFYQFSPVAYTKACKNKWLDSVCSHMMYKNVSIPQLMMKDILEYILEEKCIYNDKKIIYPLEIDCYFPLYKMGWEYDGKYYHFEEKDNIKKEKFLEKGIAFFNIHEYTENFRDYNENIKNQIISYIPQIEKITGISINSEKVRNYKIKLVLPNVLTPEEKRFVSGKTLKLIKQENLHLFNRLKKFDLFKDSSLNIIDDTRKFNKFKTFDEYKEYIISKKFLSFKEVYEKEHPHRLLKKWGIPIREIKNLFEQ